MQTASEIVPHPKLFVNIRPIDAEKFYKHIGKVSEDGCWIWDGTFNNCGYGMFSFKGRQTLAHRFVYFMQNPNADRTLQVLHRCDNPPCVNPDHLFVGTQLDNIADMDRKGRRALQGGRVGEKLDEFDVLAIKKLFETDGFYCANIARIFGVGHETIRRIRIGKAWTHIV